MGQIAFVISHARDGNDEFGLFANLIRVRVRVRVPGVRVHAKKIPAPVSVALQMTAWTSQVGWIGIEFGQATEN